MEQQQPNFEQLLRDRNTAQNDVNPFTKLVRTLGNNLWNQIPDQRTYRNLRQTNKAMAASAVLPQWRKQQLREKQIDRLIDNISETVYRIRRAVTLNDDQEAQVQAGWQQVAAENLAKEVRVDKPLVLRRLKEFRNALRIIGLAPLVQLISKKELFDSVLNDSSDDRSFLSEWTSAEELQLLYPNQSMFHLLGASTCITMGIPFSSRDVVDSLTDDDVTPTLYRRMTHGINPILDYYITELTLLTTTTNSEYTDMKLIHLIINHLSNTNDMLRAALLQHIRTNSIARFPPVRVIQEQLSTFTFLLQCIDSTQTCLRITGFAFDRLLPMRLFPWNDEDIDNTQQKLRLMMNHPLWDSETYREAIHQSINEDDPYESDWLIFILRTRIDDLEVLKLIADTHTARSIANVHKALFDHEVTFQFHFTDKVLEAAHARNPNMSAYTQMIEVALPSLLLIDWFEEFLDVYQGQADASKAPNQSLLALILAKNNHRALEFYLERFPSISNQLTPRQWQALPPSLQSKFTLGANAAKIALNHIALGNHDTSERIAAILDLRQLPLESLDEFQGLFAICNHVDVQLNEGLQIQLGKLLDEMGVPAAVATTRKRTRQQIEEEKTRSSTVCQRLHAWQNLEQNTCKAWNGAQSHPLVTWRFSNGNCVSLTGIFNYLSEGHFTDPFDSERIITQTEVVDIFTMYYTRLRFFRLLRDAASAVFPRSRLV